MITPRRVDRDDGIRSPPIVLMDLGQLLRRNKIARGGEENVDTRSVAGDERCRSGGGGGGGGGIKKLWKHKIRKQSSVV